MPPVEPRASRQCHPEARRCFAILCCAILFLAATASGQQRRDKSPVLVKVNGTPITENQVALYRLIHHVPDDPIPQPPQNRGAADRR